MAASLQAVRNTHGPDWLRKVKTEDIYIKPHEAQEEKPKAPKVEPAKQAIKDKPEAKKPAVKKAPAQSM